MRYNSTGTRSIITRKVKKSYKNCFFALYLLVCKMLQYWIVTEKGRQSSIFQISSRSYGANIKGRNQLKLPDIYTCHHLIKLYYKLYRNKVPTYFEHFIPEYGKSQQDQRHNNIRLPTIRCEYTKINANYQMHYRLRELSNPSCPPLYPIVHIDMDTLFQSLTRLLSNSIHFITWRLHGSDDPIILLV